MNIALKVIAGVLVSSVLCLLLAKQGKEMSLLLTIAVCCMVLVTAGIFIQPIISFLQNLQSLGKLNTEMMSILLKAVGIGILSELVSYICTDMGNASLGKGLQVLSVAVILWLSLPLFQTLLDLLETILGTI